MDLSTQTQKRSISEIIADLEKLVVERQAMVEKQQAEINQRKAEIERQQAVRNRRRESTGKKKEAIHLIHQVVKDAKLKLAKAGISGSEELSFLQIAEASGAASSPGVGATTTALCQTVDLMQQERASMSAKLNEKRAYISNVSDDIATELKDQQVEDKSCSKTCADGGNVTSGIILKLDDAKAKYNQMSQMKQNLVSEKCKIQQSVELVKGKIQSFASFQPELTKLDLNQLNEELQAVLGDKDGEAEYLQSPQLQIATLREISQMVTCSCVRDYKVEVGHCMEYRRSHLNIV